MHGIHSPQEMFEYWTARLILFFEARRAPRAKGAGKRPFRQDISPSEHCEKTKVPLKGEFLEDFDPVASGAS